MLSVAVVIQLVYVLAAGVLDGFAIFIQHKLGLAHKRSVFVANEGVLQLRVPDLLTAVVFNQTPAAGVIDAEFVLELAGNGCGIIAHITRNIGKASRVGVAVALAAGKSSFALGEQALGGIAVIQSRTAGIGIAHHLVESLKGIVEQLAALGNGGDLCICSRIAREAVVEAACADAGNALGCLVAAHRLVLGNKLYLDGADRLA